MKLWIYKLLLKMLGIKEKYLNEIVPVLQKELGYSNSMQVPKVQKITLNMGVGEAMNDKKAIETACDELEQASKDGDKDAIEAKSQALMEASQKLMEAAQQQQAQQGGAEAGAEQAQSSKDDDVVDAEFEEVKDDDKK